jgi:hypothetical protein
MKIAKKLTASSIFSILGVICFAGVLVSAAIIATQANTSSRDVVTVPGTLALSNVADGYEDWNVLSDAVVGTTYDQGLTFSSDWAGSYAIQVIVDATGTLAATDVTMTCDSPATTIGDTEWNVDSGTGNLYYNLGTQTSTGTGFSVNYVFTITFNTNAQAGAHISFVAVDPATTTYQGI